MLRVAYPDLLRADRVLCNHGIHLHPEPVGQEPPEPGPAQAERGRRAICDLRGHGWVLGTGTMKP